MDNNTLVSNLLRSYIRNEVVEIGDLKKVRDFLFIDDLINIVRNIYLRQNNNNLSIYNVGTGVPTSIKELVDKINTLTNKKPKIVFNPERISSEYDHDYVVADNTRILKDFPDLKLVPLERGLELTYLWELGREKDV